MRIKSNKKIQKLVDGLRGSAVGKIADSVVCGVSFIEDSPSEGSDNFHGGMQRGIDLYLKYEKKASHTLFLSSAAAGSRSKDYGIYYATQDTSDGLDYFYFIGTPNSIIEKLNRL